MDCRLKPGNDKQSCRQRPSSRTSILTFKTDSSTNPAMTVVVDYGASNLQSVVNALTELGEEARVASVPSELEGAERIILPGVGAMAPAMARLRDSGLAEALNGAVRERGTPFLGICLGMQMMAARGHEGGLETEGLGWVPGAAVRLEAAPPDWRVPHIGWTEICTEDSFPLADGLRRDAGFYFCHSYHVALEDRQHLAAEAAFDGAITAAVWRGSAIGVQFHPERSGNAGLRLIEGFLDWDGCGRDW